jgi:hypothetical protein
MPTVQTKDGDREVGSANGAGTIDDLISDEAPRVAPNKVAGEISFVDHRGRSHILRPTFEAALEIEEGTGLAVDALRTKFAMGALNPATTPTTREHGVILAAGIRAAGEPKVDVEKATRFAFTCGRKILREPMIEFLWALCDGGRLREEELKKGDLPTGSLDASADEVSSLIEGLGSRSADTSGSL